MQNNVDTTRDLSKQFLSRDFLENSHWPLLMLKYATRDIKLLCHLFLILCYVL